MKRILICLLLGFTYSFSYAQPAGKWSTSGNSTNTGDFLETTNNSSLNFKTNNIQQMNLNTTNTLKINNLSKTNSKILQTNTNDNLISLPTKKFKQILLNNKT